MFLRLAERLCFAERADREKEWEVFIESMELEKRKIYMDRMKYKAGTQIALEDDRNLQDNKPDIARILGQKGYIRLEELKPAPDHVTMRGKLYYKVLYQSDEGQEVCSVEGSIPFEEQVHMDGLKADELVQARWELDDMTIGMINSRKLSVQAVACFELFVEELYEEQVPVQLPGGAGDMGIECRRKVLDVAGITVLKKDIFRIREEMELPQNCPNIESLIWENIELSELEFKAVEEKILVKGEVRAFFLYAPQGEDAGVRVFSTAIPISGSVDCQGCSEDLITDIRYQVSQQEIEVQEDFDGERRVISLEMTLDLYMKLYREEKIEILSDCYGLQKEVRLERQETEYRTMMTRCSGKYRLSEEVSAEGVPAGAKLLYYQACVQKEGQQQREEGIEILGAVDADFLLQDENDGKFYRLHAGIPFKYLLETSGITAADFCNLRIRLENLTVAGAGESWEVKGILSFEMSAFHRAKEEMIREIELCEPDAEKYRKTPGMVGYVVKRGDSLWDIGKRYMVSLDSLKEMNHLSRDEVHAGDKMLIIR